MELVIVVTKNGRVETLARGQVPCLCAETGRGSVALFARGCEWCLGRGYLPSVELVEAFGEEVSE